MLKWYKRPKVLVSQTVFESLTKVRGILHNQAVNADNSKNLYCQK